jgi:hypothetical protein
VPLLEDNHQHTKAAPTERRFKTIVVTAMTIERKLMSSNRNASPSTNRNKYGAWGFIV